MPLRYALFSSLIAASLAGCATAYVPTVPATPLLEKGQVEVTAGLRSVHFGELGAAWSPLPHLLLTGEVAQELGTTTTTVTNAQGVQQTYYDTHQQASVGLGFYVQPKGQPGSYMAALGGMGWGQTNFFGEDDFAILSPFFPIPSPTRSGVYDVRYRRYYGQVYYASPLNGNESKGGFSLRTVWVDYTHLTYVDQPLMPSNRVFLEPSLFFRSSPGPLRGFATIGLSIPLTSEAGNLSNARTATWCGLISGGVMVRPDLLLRQLKKRE